MVHSENLLIIFTCQVFESMRFFWEFFTLVLTGCSLKSEWLQIPTTYQDSSEYSSQSWWFCMVMILSLTSKSSIQFSKLFGTVPNAPTTNVITKTFTFHSFFSSQARFKYLSIFSLSFFILRSTGTAESRSSFLLVNLNKVWLSGRD